MILFWVKNVYIEFEEFSTNNNEITVQCMYTVHNLKIYFTFYINT